MPSALSQYPFRARTKVAHRLLGVYSCNSTNRAATLRTLWDWKRGRNVKVASTGAPLLWVPATAADRRSSWNARVTACVEPCPLRNVQHASATAQRAASRRTRPRWLHACAVLDNRGSGAEATPPPLPAPEAASTPCPDPAPAPAPPLLNELLWSEESIDLAGHDDVDNESNGRPYADANSFITASTWWVPKDSRLIVATTGATRRVAARDAEVVNRTCTLLVLRSCDSNHGKASQREAAESSLESIPASSTTRAFVTTN